MRETIAYKIVSKNWKSFMLDNINPIQYNKPKKYILSYELNKKTNCIKNSIGITCFKTYTDALRFFYSSLYYDMQFSPLFIFDQSMLLKVKGIKQKPLTSFCSELNKLGYFYGTKVYNNLINKNFPSGTICFESIIPLKVIKKFK